MPRGKKTCPQCLTLTGPRTKSCSCGHKFHFKPRIFKKPKGQSIDWTTLEKGDIIRCVNGHGPYWISDSDGEKLGLNHRGTYRVMFVEEDGIGAWPYRNKSESGYTFIYMGKKHYNDDLCQYNEPHKVVLLKKGGDDE